MPHQTASTKAASVPSLEMVNREDVPSLRSRVTESLRAGIVTGRLEPGEVYSAPNLGLQLGVSATPVREAMLDLVKEGLVRTVRNKGFEVLAPSPEDLHDLLEARLLLEVPIARQLTARGVSDQDLTLLDVEARETVTTAAAADITGHVMADMQFHLSLIDLWGNHEITEMVRTLRSRSRLFGLWSHDNRDAMLESAQEHGDIVDLMRRRDAARVEKLLAAHLRRAGTLWNETPGDAK